MNGDLISREALKEHKFLTPQVKVTGGRRCGKTREQIIEAYQKGWNDAIDAIIDNAPTVPQINILCENADEKAIADMKEELQKVIDDIRPQGEWFEYIDKGLLKARHGDYVLYKVDFLLDNLAREVNIMEGARRMKGGAENGRA